MPKGPEIASAIARAADDYSKQHTVTVTENAQDYLVKSLADSPLSALQPGDEQRVYDAAISVFRQAGTEVARDRYADAQRQIGHSGLQYLDTPPEITERLAAMGPIEIDANVLARIKLPWPWGTD